MKNQFAKIVAVLMVLAMAVSVFGLCASAAETTDANTTVLLGDVNLNGEVTISDATLIQKALAKLATLDEVQAAAANVSTGDEVNIKDVTMIQKWLAKYDVNDNIGKPMATADEATPEEPVVDPSTKDEPVVDPSTKDEPVVDPSTKDEPVVDPSTKDEPVVDPSTKDEPVVDPATKDEPADFYTVAGSEGLCGVNWVPAQNVMTDDGDGTWSITFTGIAAGTYEFKVVLNGDWGTEYNLEGNASSGGANAKVEVLVDNATVIIGFDGTKAVIEFVTAPETDDPEVEDPATKDEPVVDPEVPATKDEATADEATVDEVVYYLAGYINGKDYGVGQDPDGLGYVAFENGTVTVELTDTSYVVVKADGKVFWTNGWLGEGVTEAVLGEYATNDKLMVTAGTHTFTWDAATCTLTVA